MSTRGNVNTIAMTGTSPATAITTVGAPLGRLHEFDYLVIDAVLIGGTGGALDVYIQREIGKEDSGIWADWIHFTQLPAATPATYTLTSDAASSGLLAVGIGTLAAPGVALAAGAMTTGTPGGRVRFVFVAGAGTSAGAAQTVYFTGWKVA
jgi:hypothetical protein